MTQDPVVKEEVVVDEIFFNCPKCGKSLSIDARGEGYVVACPDCNTQVQVPTAGVAAQVTSSMLGELRERLEILERARVLDKDRFAKIAEEMVMVQAALDRVVSLLQDALARERAPRPPVTPVDEPDED